MDTKEKMQTVTALKDGRKEGENGASAQPGGLSDTSRESKLAKPEGGKG